MARFRVQSAQVVVNRRIVGAALLLAHALGCGGGSDDTAPAPSDASVEVSSRADDGASVDAPPAPMERPGDSGAADTPLAFDSATPADRQTAGPEASVEEASTPAPRPTALLVTPQHASVPQYGTVQLKVTAYYPDNSTEDVTQQARLTTSDAGQLSVRGALITGLRAGTGTITATAFGLLTTATVEVTDPAQTIAVRALGVECGGDHRLSFAASAQLGVFLSYDVTAPALWSTLTPATLVFGGREQGVGQCVGPGTATVSAALDGVHAETTIEIHGAKVTSFTLGGPSLLRQGERSSLQTVAHYDDGSVATLDASGPSPHLSYASSDANIVRFHSVGEAVGVALGTAVVTASLDGKVLATGTVKVSNAALVSITITPPALTLTYPATGQLTVTGTYADGSTSDVTNGANWVTEESKLTVAGGAITVTGAGTSTVGASVEEKSAVSQVIVAAGTPSDIDIADDGARNALPVGASAPLVTWANYASGESIGINDVVTWKVADPSIAAVVGSPAQLNALKPGSTTVQITLGALSSAPVPVNVTRSLPQTIHFVDEAPFMRLGESRQLVLTADFNDGSQHEIWSPASFTITNAKIATFGDTPATSGVITARSVGQTSLRATALGLSASAVLTVEL